eukprot:GILI01021977.1.p1 GENE.GILI01021977.1~~GILI01021977.1.p1  ORF type:complete len:439 (-),score=31.75 GILI01021977.1:32-1348(-)
MTFVDFETREKTHQRLDISAEATGVFGFVFQDRVSTPKGPGTVLGVSAGGDLYFQLDSDVGCSFWGSCKSKAEFEDKGFCLIPNDSIRRHRVKKISVLGNERCIVLQDTNGPCPLLAAVNALALKGRPIDALATKSDLVTQHEICDGVERHLQTDSNGSPAIDGIDTIGGTKTLSGYVKENSSFRSHFTSAKIEALYKGLDVSPFFTDVTAFEGEKDAAFFSALGIRLFHLWVVSDNEMAEDIRNKSYNQIQDLAVSDVASSPAAASFLNYPSQITELGIHRLKAVMSEGEVGILFRNNHFSTVTKIDGELLVLVTDEGYGDKSLIVFEMLSVSGDTIYIDGNAKEVEAIVLAAMDAYGDQFSRADILRAQEKLGEQATLNDIVKELSTQPAVAAATPQEAPKFYDQLIEMGFDPTKCFDVCTKNPSTLESAVGMLLQ